MFERRSFWRVPWRRPAPGPFRPYVRRPASGAKARRLHYFLLTATAISFILAATAEENEDPARIEEEVRAVLQKQENAWNRGDVDAFMDGYARSPATLFVSGDTVTRGWETVRDRYKKKYASAELMGKLTFSELQFTAARPDLAIVIGRWELKRKDDQPHGRFTLILRHLSEGWRIVQDHTSAAEPAP